MTHSHIHTWIRAKSLVRPVRLALQEARGQHRRPAPAPSRPQLFRLISASITLSVPFRSLAAAFAAQVLQLGRHPDHHSDGGGQRRGPGVGRQGGAHVHAGRVGGAPGEGGRGRLCWPRAYGKVRENEGNGRRVFETRCVPCMRAHVCVCACLIYYC